jgi:ketosteroid isomerase-like protein
MHPRKAGSIVLMLILGFSMACTRSEQTTSAFSESDAAAVRANLTTYVAADPIDSPEMFFSQFTENVHWIYRDQQPWLGMQRLRGVEWCHTRSGEITADRVEGSGDLAYARGTYRLSLDCASGPVNSEGPFLSAHRRQQDGSWKIESLLQQ